ncbi:hypothetical protein [Nocardia sp. NPDC051570]|uniref:hypothetical protein n=1 Tax=Nocardia sp. NPDC051570 TaxID=3364324 RepID=UPI00379F8E8F
MSNAMDYPFVATVHRPGLPDVHLGFTFRHQATHASWSLTDCLYNTEHVEGTTIAWSPTPDGVSALPPLPTDSFALAELIAQEDDDLPTGHAFPDLFSRLKAQEGHETATTIWRNACYWLDHTGPERTE